ncbi:MAG: restriction endonuclease subunit S, partial [Ruminococcus sp.]|nr:restriction endonuclease subunit S [Ruminococcus sp.]
MSKLNDLINKLCPDGVEYVKIGNIATVSRGIRVVRKQLKKDGEIPVYQNSLKPLGYHEKFN